METTTNINAAAATKSKPKKIRAKLNPTKLRAEFEAYIDECIIRKRFANVAGFCVYACISRQTFYNYRSDPNYNLVMDYIDNVMEDEALNVEHRRYPIAILYLKNKFGYADKVENRNVNTNIESIISTIDDEDGLDL